MAMVEGATAGVALIRLRSVAPPVLRHLHLARVLAGAEGDVLDPVRPGLDVSHRVLVEADRVPLADIDDLVADLDPAGAADDDVDLLLRDVLVPERDAEVRLGRSGRSSRTAS